MPVDDEWVRQQLALVPEYPKWRRRNEPALLSGVLEEGERLHGMTGCLFAEYTWVLFVTDRRLLFLKQGVLTLGKKAVRLHPCGQGRPGRGHRGDCGRYRAAQRPQA